MSRGHTIDGFSSLGFFIRAAQDATNSGMAESTFPKWTQDQAIAYEAAVEAINDVIAGYSEQIAVEEDSPIPCMARIAWLEMRTSQAREVRASLNVTDIANVSQVLMEYSAIVRARDAAEMNTAAAFRAA